MIGPLERLILQQVNALFRGHCCLPLGTDFCNALSLHRHDKLLLLVSGYLQWLALCSYSSGLMTHLVQVDHLTVQKGGSISLDGFFPSTLLLVVIIVAVVIVVVMVVLIVVIGKGNLVGFLYSNRLGSNDSQDKDSSVRVPITLPLLDSKPVEKKDIQRIGGHANPVEFHKANMSQAHRSYYPNASMCLESLADEE
ncbi:hypothetical protein Tco_0216506 [Tanacetum coccineum]